MPNYSDCLIYTTSKFDLMLSKVYKHWLCKCFINYALYYIIDPIYISTLINIKSLAHLFLRVCNKHPHFGKIHNCNLNVFIYMAAHCFSFDPFIDTVCYSFDLNLETLVLNIRFHYVTSMHHYTGGFWIMSLVIMSNP